MKKIRFQAHFHLNHEIIETKCLKGRDLVPFCRTWATKQRAKRLPAMYNHLLNRFTKLIVQAERTAAGSHATEDMR